LTREWRKCRAEEERLDREAGGVEDTRGGYGRLDIPGSLLSSCEVDAVCPGGVFVGEDWRGARTLFLGVDAWVTKVSGPTLLWTWWDQHLAGRRNDQVVPGDGISFGRGRQGSPRDNEIKEENQRKSKGSQNTKQHTTKSNEKERKY